MASNPEITDWRRRALFEAAIQVNKTSPIQPEEAELVGKRLWGAWESRRRRSNADWAADDQASRWDFLVAVLAERIETELREIREEAEEERERRARELAALRARW